ncbi:MAG: glycosyltransferase family 4 protein [Pseudomonadales bacterium]|nr:glycosyltransferase family 4 protein [Pseudomonadales bacterium]
MNLWWLVLTVFVVSLGLTLVLRRYALVQSLMDVPNERSSHSVPTPRGGGVAIVIAFALALPLLLYLDLVAVHVLYGLLGAGLIVAVIGFADDHRHIPVRWRLLGHFAAASWALFWFRGLAPVQFFDAPIDLGLIGNIFALFYLVWMLNLYNFMDGIDGLASVEAISVCLSICLIYWLCGTLQLIWPALILASAVGGFLFWNFPPARIFMGDAGSGFLGLVLAALALQAMWTESNLLWSWLILLGVFIIDATWTLMRRLMRGDKIYQAHRSHAYQLASRSFDSHLKVVSAVLAINVVWLLPLAFMVACGLISGPIGLFIAYTPLAMLAYKLRAGAPETIA